MKQSEQTLLLAVNGTLMRGLPLENNLLRVGASFMREANTAPCYRLWSVRDEHPAMLRVDPDTDKLAAKIALELWSVPLSGVAEVLLGEPAGLCVGKVVLDNGERVLGVLGEPELIRDMQEITRYGGWRAYLAAQGK